METKLTKRHVIASLLANGAVLSSGLTCMYSVSSEVDELAVCIVISSAEQLQRPLERERCSPPQGIIMRTRAYAKAD